MIWAVLAFFGVPLWLIVGALAAAAFSRRSFIKQPGVFEAKIRLIDGNAVGIGANWQFIRVNGRWIHDVLLINRGVALMRVTPIGATGRAGERRLAPRDTVTIRGRQPLVQMFYTDTGARFELACLDAAPLSPPGVR